MTKRHLYTKVFEVRRLVFLLSCCVLFLLALDKVLTLKAPEYMMMDTFYNVQDKALIDVICLGSSQAYTSCNTEVYWNEYGIPVYCLSSPGQPAAVSYFYLKEALEYTKPKIVLLELSTISSAYNGGAYHYGVAVTSLKYSLNRLAVIALGGVPNNLKTSLLSNVIFYHNRFKDITQHDIAYALGNKRRNTHGFNPWWEYKQYSDHITRYGQEYSFPPNDKAIEYVEKICDLCRNNDIILMTYVSPHDFSKDAYGQINWWRAFFKNKQIDMIDSIQLLDELHIDPEKDVVNGHASYYGAKKISSYIGNIIKNRGCLTDHRGEKRYSKWEEDANYYKKNERIFEVKNLNNEIDLESYLSSAMKINDAVIIVDYSGNNTMNEKIEACLTKMGISIDLNSENAFLGIYVNGVPLYEKQDDEIAWKGEATNSKIDMTLTNTNDKGDNIIIDYKRLYASEWDQTKNTVRVYLYSKDVDECTDFREFEIN